MRRMLDPKELEGESLPSTIKFDEEGNRTVGKNLKVDGKLTLKSLVSASNPDGDITKELGGGGGGGAKIYRHCISISQNAINDKLEVYFTYYTTSQTKFVMATLKNIIPDGKTYECSGYYVGGSGKGPIINLLGSKNFPFLKFGNVSASGFTIENIILDDYRFALNDEVSEVN